MNTVTFFQNIITWLLADPSHLVVAATLADSLIPTPDPRTPIGKLYKVIELFALSFLHAKESGIPPNEQLEQQILAILAKQHVPAVALQAPAPVAEPAAPAVAPQ
jgi:hypothetical protein